MALVHLIGGLKGTQSFNVQGGRAATVTPCAVTLEVVGDLVKLKVRKFFAHGTTPKQRAQRTKWCDADFMYRHMTNGQFALYKRYYWQERHAKRTLKARYKTTKEVGGFGAGKDMGYYAYWMKKALSWDLKAYLDKFLGSTWVIGSIMPVGGGYMVSARLEHKDTWRQVYEPKEKDFIRGR